MIKWIEIEDLSREISKVESIILAVEGAVISGGFHAQAYSGALEVAGTILTQQRKKLEVIVENETAILRAQKERK